ncbi:MAG: hypothetical protein HDS71_06200 [Bacteroidales bacterium]|nr:hypothetical protein [Bacteroidales bacterium]
MMESTPKYSVYPSLLDKFQDLLDYEKVAEEDWNKDSETGEYKLTPDEMFLKIESELIDTINRCRRTSNEAADKGTAFNEVVDCLIEQRKPSEKFAFEKLYTPQQVWVPEKMGITDNMDVTPAHYKTKNVLCGIRVSYNGWTFDFDYNLCKEASDFFVGSLTQFFTQSILPTAYGDVEIYGFIDEWPDNKMFDIKTTGRYTFGKFERKWQRHAYPWCVINSGMATEIESFTYWVVEWAYQRNGDLLKAKSITQETYTYDHQESEMRLREHIEKFIEWLESRREFITDKKIFGGKNQPGYQGIPVDIEKLIFNI